METTTETPPAAPAAEPVTTETPPAGDAPPAAPAGDGQPAPEGAGDQPAPAAAAPNGKAKAKTEEPPPAEPKRGPDLTKRLASLSRDKREAERAARVAEQARQAAEAKAGEFNRLMAKVQAGDDTAIDEIFSKFGVSFERVVNHYASKGDEPTPEQKRDRELADIKAKFEKLEKERTDEAARAQARAEEATKAELIGGISQAIQKQGEKFEICARLGDEAAQDVYNEVVKAWDKAGRPQLDPGEFEEAVDAAIDVMEQRYELRGQQLIKKGKANGANGTANGHANGTGNGAPKLTSELPANIAGGKLSDKDEDIIAGLIDKTAPGANSQRAKPRTINSSMGGSAPPKAPPTGSMDPREALRVALQQFQR